MNAVKGFYRLTLSPAAMQVAVTRQAMPIIQGRPMLRPDGKFDVPIKMSTLNLLRQLAYPNEDLSDTVIRVLKKKG